MENKQYTTRELFCRFAPYFKKYRFTLCMDLFCAALTTVCELGTATDHALYYQLRGCGIWLPCR